MRGHRDQITAIRFLQSADNAPSSSTATAAGLLLTSSKDTFVKLWDLSTQHCIQTVVAHRTDVWSLAVDADESLFFTGSADGELKAWSIDRDALAEGLKETESGDIVKIITPAATLPLASKHRVAQIAFHPTKPYLAVQSHDRTVEIFRIRTEEEVRKKQARRQKRAKAKGKEVPVAEDAEEIHWQLVDLFTPYLVIRASGKCRSFDFGPDNSKTGAVQILLGLSTNSVEIYSIPPPTKNKESPPEASRLYTVDIPGHRTDVRALSLTRDDQILASASNGAYIILYRVSLI